MAQRRKKSKTYGITRRWVTTSLLSTIMILVVASVAILFSLRSNYYANARQALEYRVRSTMRQIPSSSTMTNQERVAKMRSMVEDFSEKDKFEFMLVDISGNILVTSSGFSYDVDETPQDYLIAASAPDGQGSAITRSPTGEHTIAVTQMLTSTIGDTQAIRFVSSLKNIDSQLFKMAQIVVLVCLIVLGFTIFSGLYFIRSIVIPLGEIGDTARRISGGDYDVRIKKEYDGEIGELCGTINDMAFGLSETTRMKNEFISSVSHELRTPLTSIKGWGETLAALEPDDRENFNKGMKIILNETDRLSILVEDLLDFSRLKSSAIKVVMEPLDLVEELREAVSIVEQRALRQNIRFKYKPRYKSIRINADKNRIRQVFANIFDNAIKYSKPGDTVTVSVAREGGMVSIATRDMGLGIPPQDLAKVTTRFFKASNSVTGSGIGLAVVKEIVNTHGGELRFESELGKGTTVTVRLPVLDAKKAEGAQGDAGAEAPDGASCEARAPDVTGNSADPAKSGNQ